MITVRVVGEDRVARAFGKLKLKVRDLANAWERIGAKIRRDAIPLTPVLSGALVNTLRSGKTKTQAVVRAGNARIVYAGVQNYGWPGHNITGKHFLNRALEQNEDYAEQEVMREINRLIRASGLG